MDPSTAAAIAAVAIAVLAFVVAFAQVLQQYFATATLLRLCDSVVYGPLPGHGRRVWQAGQFRFRIIYTLPQLRLEKRLWDEDDNDDVDLHKYSYIEEWSDRMYSRPSLLRRICGQISNTLVKEWHYVSRTCSFPIQCMKWILHHVVQTTVAQNISSRCSSLSSRRVSTKYRSLSSSLGKFFNCTIGGFQESSLGERSEVSVTVEMIPYSPIDLFEPTGKRSGAASWASFIWVVQRTSNDSLRFEVAEGDADRCPSDLPNVPMQVSLRDIIILGLQTGMKITSPYVDIETGKFSMVGRAGWITCSKHPILGSLLHFSPSGFDAGHSWLVDRDQRKINKLWALRANNYAIIAGRAYSNRERVHLDALDGDWLEAAPMEGFEPDERRNRLAVQRYTQDDHKDRKTTHSESKSRRPKNKQSESTQASKSASGRRSTSSRSSSSSSSASWKLFTDKSEDIDCHNENTTHDVRALPVNEPSKLISQPSTVALTEVEDEISSHHASRSDDSLANGDESMLFEGTGIAPDSGTESNDGRQDKTDPTEVGNPVSVAYQGPSHASKENSELAIFKSPETSRFNAKKPDENPEKRGQGESLPSSSSSNATTTPPVRTGDREKVPSEDHDRQDSGHTSDEDTGSVGTKLKRDGQREEPSQRRRRDWKRTYDLPDHEYNQLEHYRGRIKPLRTFWQWFSQMDIMHGYWATPWESCVVAETIEGALPAILAALSARLNKRNLQYIPPNGEVKEVLEWASGGRSTWPMYAMNARGGVIVQENKTKFKFPGFSSKIAAVELLHDHRWQVERYTEPTETDEKLAELMVLDSWLSICGREPEIFNGASDLRHNMPFLIDFWVGRFEDQFEKLDRTANEGGLQHIQRVARSLVATLDHEKLSAAE
ncbi:MAG: hypothetical protein Q9180_003216 [Flavoplaca navasiana]